MCSCVSKKKHHAALEQLRATHAEQIAEHVVVKQGLQSQKEEWHEKALLYKGSNNALTLVHNTLLNRIDSLRDEIALMGNRSKSSQADLMSTISGKEKQIKELKLLLKRVEESLDQQLALTSAFKQKMSVILAQSSFESITMKNEEEAFTLIIPNEMLFQPKSINRLKESGKNVLDAFVSVSEDFPQMNYIVVAHTDNRPPTNRNYKDNWSYSSVISARIVRYLTDELGMGANQVTVGAKGEYEPRASNETAEGRMRNNRVEIRATPVSASLQRSIRSLLSDTNWN